MSRRNPETIELGPDDTALVFREKYWELHLPDMEPDEEATDRIVWASALALSLNNPDLFKSIMDNFFAENDFTQALRDAADNHDGAIN